MTERILIIDDEENIRQMIRLTLEASGYEVGEAEDGIEAFAILGGDPEWNVILLDQRLPVMEGTEVLRRLKVLAPLARVVMMTAFASVEIAVEAMKLGASDFLRKPMTPEVVRNSVSAAISKHSAPPMKLPSADINRQASTASVTINGFTIIREGVNSSSSDSSNERRFLVRKPNGKEQEVVVEISDAALQEAKQVMAGTALENTFWTSQAQTFLSDFIWNDGNVPPGGRLVLKGIDRDAVGPLFEQKRKDE